MLRAYLPRNGRRERVNVDAAQARGVQDRLGQQQTVGNYHHQVGTQFPKLVLFWFALETGGLENGNFVFQGQLFNRAGGQFAAASGGSVRLGVDGQDPVPAVQQGLQGRYGKIRGAGKNDAQWG